ncbi:52 kDa repressor of the inhibitor of the protein kinase-like [Adelges cooleyi]|uniref:52 kDa repressor of the inhibitor of the protein kinase-like n=1 Tax=Adelges cooleyi TaxID=133065 RepID=UPI0021809146|nr:52 kDa repressor of the inhibitor of the protein kinase-like [Adelges cooleyi]
MAIIYRAAKVEVKNPKKDTCAQCDRLHLQITNRRCTNDKKKKLISEQKKPQENTEASTDLERTVPSLSNVFQDEDTVASETKQAASSVEVSSPVFKHILDSKFDIGAYVEFKQNLSDEEKVSILQNVWTPDYNKNIDLFNALKQVTQVVSVLNTIRENVDLKFNDIYKDAQGIAIKLNVEPKIPRTCSNQKNRSNVPFNNIEDFYKKTIFIPYLDDLIMALNERFLPHNETIISLQFVLPRIIVEKPFFNLKKAVEFYKSDLPGLNDIIEAEYEIWQAKWKNIEENLRPATAIEALRACDRLMYPNIFELLKILAIIPVSTATAERSFSTLRRLKTYLRNTTSESRLVGLALLSIHRDIDVNDDMVLDKFANSGKERNLNLI